MTWTEMGTWDLTDAEREALARIAQRLSARHVAVYRTSEGLFAFIVDQGYGEHTGVRII